MAASRSGDFTQSFKSDLKLIVDEISIEWLKRVGATSLNFY